MYSTLFKEYYLNNKGKLFKHFEIIINKSEKPFDIYWGDPDIIFEKSLDVPYPLAFIKFPQWAHEPNTRIYLHEKIDLKYSTALEYILAHEIGHFCLFDIFGINHPKGNDFLNVMETEIWADYFAYLYFIKFGNINNLEQLENILLEVDNLQNILYRIPSYDFIKYSYINKMKYLVEFKNKIEIALNNNVENTHLMIKTFDEILMQINKLV